MTPDEKFWAKVDRSAGGGCWPWTGAVNAKRGGYGCLRRKKKTLWAHRYAWTLANGREPAPGMNVCHRCANHAWPWSTTSRLFRSGVPSYVRRCRTCQRARQDRLNAYKRAKRRAA